MYNPFLNRGKHEKKQSPAYWRSKKQEKKTAKDMDAYRVSGSGSGRTKGDVRKMGVVRIECKATSKLSFSVTRDMLDKIEMAALGSDEIPAICIEFLNDKGKVEREVAVIPYQSLLDLVTRWRL